jgi:hypothetical protein
VTLVFDVVYYEKKFHSQLFIVFLAGRHLCFYGAAQSCTSQLVGKKHSNAFCSCPNAHQLMHIVRSAMETKMAVSWEYNKLLTLKYFFSSEVHV